MHLINNNKSFLLTYICFIHQSTHLCIIYLSKSKHLNIAFIYKNIFYLSHKSYIHLSFELFQFFLLYFILISIKPFLFIQLKCLLYFIIPFFLRFFYFFYGKDIELSLLMNSSSLE